MAPRSTSQKAGSQTPARTSSMTRTTRTNSSIRSTTATPRATTTNGTSAAVKGTTEVINKSGTPKLGKGGLESAVLDHMAANPKSEYSPADLARVLGRSSGAIANALAKFATRGTVTQTNERPRRYRLATAKATRSSTRKR